MVIFFLLPRFIFGIVSLSIYNLIICVSTVQARATRLQIHTNKNDNVAEQTGTDALLRSNGLNNI